MPRVLLILPSKTYRAADFMRAAATVGAQVVVASEHRQALSRGMAERALVVSLDRPERAAAAIVEHARGVPLDAVVAVDDRGTRAAALACAALGLRGNPPEAVARTRDKAAMREALGAAGVPQPRYRVAAPGADVAELARTVGLPCVVKPLSLSASQGVIRADSEHTAAAAAARVRAIVESVRGQAQATLLVERYVPGVEVALEGLLRAGALTTLAVFDKPDPLEGPYFEETIYVTPSRLAQETLDRIERAAAAAAAALGLSEGPVHAEMRVGPAGEVTVLELAARSIGGLCARTLRFGLGVSLEELIVRHALGLPLDHIERERAAAGVMMLPIPGAGVLAEVGGAERARALPGIAGLEISIRPGGALTPLPEGDRYLGFMFAKCERPEQVEAVLRAARAELEIVLEDEPAATPA